MTTKSYTIKEFKELTKKIVKEQLALVRKVISEADDPSALTPEEIDTTISAPKDVQQEFERLKNKPLFDRQGIARALQKIVDDYSDEETQELESYYQDWNIADFAKLLKLIKWANKEQQDEPVAPVEIEKAPTPKPGSAASINTLASKIGKKDKFGSWVLRHYSKYFPTGTDPEKVVDLLKDRNFIKTLPLSPRDILGLYRQHVGLQKDMRTSSVKMTLDAMPSGNKKDELRKTKSGELPYEEIAKQLEQEYGGTYSKEAVRLMINKILEKITPYAKQEKIPGVSGKVYTEEEFEVDPVDFAYDVSLAADKYLIYLEKYIENFGSDAATDPEDADLTGPEGFLAAFNEFVLKSSRIEAADQTEEETAAIKHLMELVKSGRKEEAKKFLIDDLTRPEGNFVRTFQNLLAKILHPETRGRKAQVA
jgi:hypothetical protein